MKAKILPPIHSGEILREEFLEPMGISQYRLAKSLSVAARRINDGVNPQMTGYRIKSGMTGCDV
jgi:addiction module HigA family antidote